MGCCRAGGAGRRSAYALTLEGQREFLMAAPRIYGAPPTEWDGRLRLAFPDAGADRSGLDAAGFALLAPGVLVGPGEAPAGVAALTAEGSAATLRMLAERAWPLERLREAYVRFSETFGDLSPGPEVCPLDAMAARITLIHAWRRIALRDPGLPPALLPPDWPGAGARALCVSLYGAFCRPSEAWLDAAGDGAGGVPRGADPRARFAG